MSHMKLPTTPGETVDLYYEHDVDGYAERIVITCKSNEDRPCWIMRIETGEHFEDEIEWMSGLPVSRLARCWTDLALALREHDSVASQFMRVTAKGDLRVPPVHENAIKFVKLSGWWVAWGAVGDTSSGEPIIDLEFSRPLCGEEMITMLDRMTKAFDAWQQEGYEWMG